MRYFYVTMFWFLALSASAAEFWGNFPDGGTLYFYTNTVGTDGVGETPAAETLRVYRGAGGNGDLLSSGVSIDDDYESAQSGTDALTGLHRIAIDTTLTGFDAGSQYTVIYTAGTVDGVSIAGRVIGSFFLGPKNADVTHFGGSAGTFSSGLPAVNASHLGGTPQTGRDIGASVLLSPGNGTGQLDIASGKLAWNSAWDAEAQSEAADALNAYDPPTRAEATSDKTEILNLSKSTIVHAATIAGVDSQTTFAITPAYFSPADALVDYQMVIRDASDSNSPKRGSVRRIVHSGATDFEISADPEFTIEAGDIIEIYPPDLEILTRVPNASPNASGGLLTVGSSTGQLNPTGGNVGLKDDAITSDKFDELTAYPLKSPDTGDSTVLRKGSASVNGTSIDGKINTLHTLTDGIASAVGTIEGVVEAIFAFLDGAPTFSEAMDGQGYNSDRAAKLDNLDMPVSEVRTQMPSLLVSSEIDDTSVTVTQTSFALEDGPSDNNALNGALVIVTAAGDNSRKAVGVVKDYDGLSKTITLVTDPGVFEFESEDIVDVIATGEPAAMWIGSTP